ncbi:MAG: hypothetical protein IT373_34965 [Polyangiaceae bacterium]|nr:hypothetical protein [Polyangiaceae bacterium]
MIGALGVVLGGLAGCSVGGTCYDCGPCGIAGPNGIDYVRPVDAGLDGSDTPVVVLELRRAGECENENATQYWLYWHGGPVELAAPPPNEVLDLSTVTEGDKSYTWEGLGLGASYDYPGVGDLHLHFADGVVGTSVLCEPSAGSVSCAVE